MTKGMLCPEIVRRQPHYGIKWSFRATLACEYSRSRGDMALIYRHTWALAVLLAACGSEDRTPPDVSRADGGAGLDASADETTHVSYSATADFTRYGDRPGLRAAMQIEMRKEQFGASFTCSLSNQYIAVHYGRGFMVPECDNMVGTGLDFRIDRATYKGPGRYTFENMDSVDGRGVYMSLSPYLRLTTADPDCPPNHCLGITAMPSREAEWISCMIEIVEHTSDYVRGSFSCTGGSPNVADLSCPGLRFGSLDANGTFLFLAHDCPPQ